MEMRFVSVEARRHGADGRVICFCRTGRGGGKLVDFAEYRRRYGLTEEEPEEGPQEEPAGWRERISWLAELTATVSVALMAGGVLARFWLG